MRKAIYNWLFRKAVKVIAINIVKHGNKLTTKYLLDRGWIEKDGYYIEPCIKDRDLISIKFESNYYRVWHSSKRTFIATERTIEWFESYYLIINSENGRYDLAGI